jgi:hypothetical protein
MLRSLSVLNTIAAATIAFSAWATTAQAEDVTKVALGLAPHLWRAF